MSLLSLKKFCLIVIKGKFNIISILILIFYNVFRQILEIPIRQSAIFMLGHFMGVEGILYKQSSYLFNPPRNLKKAVGQYFRIH